MYRKKLSHLIMITGFILFGIFWLTQVPHYIEIDDTVNAAMAAFAFPLFLYFAYHEYLNIKWNEELIPTRFFAGVSFVSGMLYYIIENMSLKN